MAEWRQGGGEEIGFVFLCGWWGFGGHGRVGDARGDAVYADLPHSCGVQGSARLGGYAISGRN
jgi:hypothetical protein